MQYDKSETIGNSLIQHGPHSNRVYLMKLAPADHPEIIHALDSLAEENGYSKIFAKVPSAAADAYVADGFRKEAVIPGFYNGDEDAVFLGKYLDSDRATPDNQEILDNVLELTKAKASTDESKLELPDQYQLIACKPDHTEEMGEIYREVFPTYPFPIHDPAYIRETMESHIDYFGILQDSKLIALSSAEMDTSGCNVEMTDFATLPAYRGKGFARCLLKEMESAMLTRGMITAFTIARAVSPGMNITFAQMGYTFSGTLINNTQISGTIESMNIWHKPLKTSKD